MDFNEIENLVLYGFDGSIFYAKDEQLLKILDKKLALTDVEQLNEGLIQWMNREDRLFYSQNKTIPLAMWHLKQKSSKDFSQFFSQEIRNESLVLGYCWTVLRKNGNLSSHMHRRLLQEWLDCSEPLKTKVKSSAIPISWEKVFKLSRIRPRSDWKGVKTRIYSNNNVRADWDDFRWSRFDKKFAVCLDCSFTMKGRLNRSKSKTAFDLGKCLALNFWNRANHKSLLLPFKMDVVDLDVDREDSFKTNVKRLDGCLGGGGEISVALRWLNRQDETADVVVLISDDQTALNQNQENWNQWLIFKKRNPQAKLFAIDLIPNPKQKRTLYPDVFQAVGYQKGLDDVLENFVLKQEMESDILL